MKQSTLITICLVVLMVFGWMSGFMSIGNKNEKENEYETYIEVAKEYESKGLYQKAAQEYDKAITMNDTEELWTEMLNAYEKCYEEDPNVYDEYLKKAQGAVAEYSKNADMQYALAQLYASKKEYEAAYKALKKAVDNGVRDEKITDLYQAVKYAYNLEWSTYSEYRGLSEGYYAVNHNGIWEYLAEDGTTTEFGDVLAAGSVGADGVRMIQVSIYDSSETADTTNGQETQDSSEFMGQPQARLVNEDEVLQGFFDFLPQNVGIYADGLIPVQQGDRYAYYDLMGDKQFGDYLQAGTFVDGIAAVQDETGWYLISTDGKPATDTRYEEIVLNPDDTYIKNGIMLAKQDGNYHIYNDEEEIGSYSDIDVMTEDGIIAVCNDGKWGFVDTQGNEVLAPEYKEAKSFSSGLAAVSNGNKWGFIDTDGNLVIEYTFLNADYFNTKMNCLVEDTAQSWKLLTLYNKK